MYIYASNPAFNHINKSWTVKKEGKNKNNKKKNVKKKKKKNFWYKNSAKTWLARAIFDDAFSQDHHAVCLKEKTTKIRREEKLHFNYL